MIYGAGHLSVITHFPLNDTVIGTSDWLINAAFCRAWYSGDQCIVFFFNGLFLLCQAEQVVGMTMFGNQNQTGSV